MNWYPKLLPPALVVCLAFSQAESYAQAPVRAALSSSVVASPLPRERELFTAARDGDISKLRSLIRSGVNCNARTEEGDTILTLAAQGNREDAVRAALEFKPELNRRGGLGMSALSLATVHGLNRSVERLLRAGADVNVADSAGVTPLAAALRLGRFELARRLLDAGADPRRADQSGTTPLHILAARGDDTGPERPALAPLLLDLGADPNVADAETRTPLFLAILNHHDEVARVLISRRNTILTKTTQGYAPLFWARQMENQMLADLIEARIR